MSSIHPIRVVCPPCAVVSASATMRASCAALLFAIFSVAGSAFAAPGDTFCFTDAPTSELISCEYAQGDSAPRQTGASEIAANKKTRSGKLLFASEAHALVRSREVLFVDVRTRGEFSFVGVADGVRAHVPFADITDASVWEPKSGRYSVSQNPKFVAEVAGHLRTHQLDHHATIVLICRSGDRSARAADVLAEAGYRNVYSVVDGFEGDLSAAERRDVNGWKNAGLPWSYRGHIGEVVARK